MLKGNTLSYILHGEKIRLISMLMEFIPFESFGEQQGRLGKKYCWLRWVIYKLFSAWSLFSTCFAGVPYIHFLNQGENLLVVTHKSILRALICIALGLGPERYCFSHCVDEAPYYNVIVFGSHARYLICLGALRVSIIISSLSLHK